MQRHRRRREIPGCNRAPGARARRPEVHLRGPSRSAARLPMARHRERVRPRSRPHRLCLHRLRPIAGASPTAVRRRRAFELQTGRCRAVADLRRPRARPMRPKKLPAPEMLSDASARDTRKDPSAGPSYAPKRTRTSTWLSRTRPSTWGRECHICPYRARSSASSRRTDDPDAVERWLAAPTCGAADMGESSVRRVPRTRQPIIP
jgi:hypothetical protein